MTEETTTKLIETTIKDMGITLCVGTSSEGSALDKRVEFSEMTTADEKEINKKSRKGVTMGNMVTIVLAQMVTRLGEFDFTKLSAPEKLLRINQLYMGDVLLSYMHLRIDTMGPEYMVEITCPCSPSKPFKVKADLHSTKVTAAKAEDDMVWEYKLVKPRKFRDKQVTSLTLTSPRWGSISTIPNGSSQRQAMIEGVRTGVLGFNGAKDPAFTFLEEEFGQLSKVDLENMMQQLDKHVVGPHMAVEVSCPKCEREMISPIGWQYESFFAASSRS